ncbi:MAG TPA: T9SS type B sorting domain-containing protein [Bacteroidetes bacterium]|nr:T9SS type B sorting domain-containing protein [Bacteroidota bacterium]
MKNLSFFLILVFSLAAHFAFAQPTFRIEPDFQLVDQNDQVCYEITTEDFSDLLSISFSLTWDPGVLSSPTVGNLNPNIAGLDMSDFELFEDDGILTFQWSVNAPCNTGANVQQSLMPDGQTIFELCFTATGIYGNHTPIEFADEPVDMVVHRKFANCQDIGENTFDGFLSIGTNPLGVNISSADGLPDDIVCIDFKVEDFDHLISNQYFIFWNPNVLEYDSHIASGIPGFGPANIGTSLVGDGTLLISWNTTNDDGISVPDGTQILQLCFKIVGSCGQTSAIWIDDNGDQLIEIIDAVTDNTNGTNIGLLDNPGEVSVLCNTDPNAIGVTIPDKNVCPGEDFVVDIKVDNFQDIVKLQFNLKWNPAIIQLNNSPNGGITFPFGEPCFQFDSPGSITASPPLGLIEIDWEGGFFGVCDLSDNYTLMRLHFTAIGSSGTNSTISVVNPILVDRQGGLVENIGINIDNGLVSICELDNPTLIASSATVFPGEQVCIEVTPQDFDDITGTQYTIQWEPNILSYSGVQNFNLTGLNSFNFLTDQTQTQGVLGVEWQNGTAVSVPDGLALFEVCFDVVGDVGECSLVSFAEAPWPVDIVTATSNNTNVGLNGQPGEVCIDNPFTFSLSANDLFGVQGERVCVDITAQNFNQITRFQHSLGWDNSVVQFEEIVSTGNLPGFNASSYNIDPVLTAGGQLTVNWTTDNIQGSTVPDGMPLFQVCFTIIGDPDECTGINFNDFPVPYVVNTAPTGDSNIPLEGNNGSICVNNTFLTYDNAVITQVNCPTEPTGSIDITINGGSGNYIYNWAGQGVDVTAEDQFSLFPGTYEVTVTDAENPSLVLRLEYQVLLSPDAPVADAGLDTAFSCIGGVQSLTLNGGGSSVGNFSYSWANEPGSPFMGIILSGGDTPFPTVIGGECYELTVTHNLTGCAVSDVVCIQAPVKPNPAIVQDVPELTCARDTVVLNGGQPPVIFEFEWIEGIGGHIVPGTDTSFQPEVTESAWYYLRMFHEQTGCEGMDSVFVEVNKDEPIADAGDDDGIGCLDDDVPLDGSNSSTGDFSYAWSANGGGEICGDPNAVQTKACAPGTYQLMVTDNTNGCTSIAEVLITGDTLKPTADAGLRAEINCFLTEANLGGTGTSVGDDYIYIWTDENGTELGTDLELSVTEPGVYSLEVQDTTNGCKAISQVAVVATDSIPVVMATVDHAITCLLDTASLDGTGSSTGSVFVYQWMDENGMPAGNELSIQVTEPGTYTLFINNEENGCADSTTVEVLDLNDDVPVDAGELQLIGCDDEAILDGATNSNSSDLVFQWSGPANCITEGTSLTPSVACPGTYQLLAVDTVTGCTGLDMVMVEADTTLPMVEAGADEIMPCSAEELELMGSTDISDPVIEWTNSSGLPINDPNSLNPTIENPGTYILTITSPDNNCSDFDFVQITEPDPPMVSIEGDTLTDCLVTEVELSGAASTAGVTYAWEVLNNSGEIPAGQENEELITVPAGEYQLTVTDLNGCTAVSSFTVTGGGDLPNVEVGADVEIPCTDGFIEVGATADPGLTYTWTDEDGMILSSDLVVNIAQPGTYTLTVFNAANNCQNSDSLEATAGTGSDPAEAAFDHDPCSVEAVLLGNLPNGTSGVWTTSNGAVIADPSLETTTATNLSEGENVFTWSLSIGNCIDYSSASVSIDVDQSVPSASPDLSTVAEGSGGTTAFNILENDSYNPDETMFNLLDNNATGEVGITGEGLLTYTKTKCFVGTVEMQYELCNINCPEICDTTSISIEVEADAADGCDEVPNGITPNNDGVNDELVFDVLLNNGEEFPNNEIIIFNRWGDIVYQARPYLNDWRGTNESGKELPPATYYYILRLDVANGEIIRGDVTILK